MARFILTPQWQGSPAARAMLLVDGADAIADDLPRSSTVRVNVPAEAGDALGGRIRRRSALERVRQSVREALEADSELAIVVGGDCSVAVPAVAHAVRHHSDVAVVWFDAHGDVHSAESSPSGAYAGMALRAVLGDSELSDVDATIRPERAFLLGARALDEEEATYVSEQGVRHFAPAAFADPPGLAEAIVASGARAVYIHVDVDVLDPSAMTGLLEALPFGVSVAELTATIGAIRARLPLVGASLAGFAPAHASAALDDMGSILRIVGALA